MVTHVRFELIEVTASNVDHILFVDSFLVAITSTATGIAVLRVNLIEACRC